MKKKIIVISATLIMGILLYFSNIKSSKAYSYGPPAGYTGSPHDGKTCDYSNCHNTHPLQGPKPWISSNVPLIGYSPDTVYTFTAKAIQSGYTSFGFEISPQSANGTELGKLIVSNASTTQITSSKYIEQTVYGYQGTDSVVWTFQWKAPVAGTGSVTFYGAFNCGNGNSSPVNSYVYTAALTIPENLSAGIERIANSNVPFTIFPNPAKNQVNITYSLNEIRTIEINIYDINGRKISTLLNTIVSTGEHVQYLLLPSGVKPGIYLIRLISDGASSVQRIMIEE